MFRIGDKVRVMSKSVDKWTNYDCTWQGMLGYIVRIKGDGSGTDPENCLIVHEKKGHAGGDFLAPRDLELIKPAKRT
jgi:hypothetical protein